MKVYRIRDWDKHFENNRTRELKRMDWVPVPNRHDGDGFTALLDHKNGMAHYGAWHLILQVASKCDPRGTLLREGAGGVKTAHTPASIARITRGDTKTISEAIVRLLSIGWLELYENPALACGNPAPTCALVPMEGNGREWKGMEGNGNIESDAPAGADTSKKKTAFKAPESEHAHAYAVEIGLDKNECDVYLDHYATNGWRTKTGPVKDWKAAMRNWKRRSAEFKNQRNFAPATAVAKVPVSQPLQNQSHGRHP